jgi:hypothetical protein
MSLFLERRLAPGAFARVIPATTAFVARRFILARVESQICHGSRQPNSQMGATEEVDKIIQEVAKFSRLDEEAKASMRRDLHTRWRNGVNGAILESQPFWRRKSFGRISKSGTADEYEKFIRRHVSEFQEIVAIELKTLRRHYGLK